MKLVFLLVLVEAVCLLALVAADDSDTGAGYIADYEGGAAPEQSWIQRFFTWLGGFFYTTDPGEIITNRPIQQMRYASPPYDPYAPIAYPPNYPIAYPLPKELQEGNYAYLNHIETEPHNIHSNYAEGAHHVASPHPAHDTSYPYPPPPPGAKIRYPYFYDPAHPVPPQHVVHKPTANVYSEHRPGRPYYTKQKKRRPWPQLTNAGKSPQQIEREAKELQELVEFQRDREHSKLSLHSLPH